ncbi:hypothetical protein [Actinacidiphila guanduensis]|jgi:hypothetical protein|uniref:Uncharacterized protein n=1 Tax=Actinacidiphila guanduensis TaxID=310781 RepID=A0A1H0LLZ9_9ACTN|nr:hypothetical protein [Actinacidiphila guanduensis]SDO69056.1 hypothetical protein SAMN05216259_111255 [Actinacidiphila guanduensis]
MVGTLFLVASGLVFVVLGGMFIQRRRRRHASARAGWAACSVGVGQLLHAIGSQAGHQQPLALILAISSAAFSIGGLIVVATLRRRRPRQALPTLDS